jgi:hypothetical protein
MAGTISKTSAITTQTTQNAVSNAIDLLTRAVNERLEFIDEVFGVELAIASMETSPFEFCLSFLKSTLLIVTAGMSAALA